MLWCKKGVTGHACSHILKFEFEYFEVANNTKQLRFVLLKCDALLSFS